MTRLMLAHQSNPLPKNIGKKVLEQESELQVKMEATGVSGD